MDEHFIDPGEEIRQDLVKIMDKKFEEKIIEAISNVKPELAKQIEKAKRKPYPDIECLKNILSGRLIIKEFPDGTQVYNLDNEPILEILPPEYDFEGKKLKAKQNYKILT